MLGVALGLASIAFPLELRQFPGCRVYNGWDLNGELFILVRSVLPFTNVGSTAEYSPYTDFIPNMTWFFAVFGAWREDTILA